MTKKTIQRLFPCDDSMVVVLDDRADVWEWSRSLIKVRPCMCSCEAKVLLSASPSAYSLTLVDHFFKGTGDINQPPNAAVHESVPTAAALPPPPKEEVVLRDPVDVSDDDGCILTSPSVEDLEINHAELPFPVEEYDQELVTLTRVLRRLHDEFYNGGIAEPTVKVCA